MTVRTTRFRQSVIRTVLGLAALSGLAMQPVESAFAKVVEVSMTAVETKLVIDGEGHTYDAWTFNGQFPGPVIRVQEGDDGSVLEENHPDVVEHRPSCLRVDGEPDGMLHPRIGRQDEIGGDHGAECAVHTCDCG